MDSVTEAGGQDNLALLRRVTYFSRRPRRRSKYSAAAEGEEQYSDPEDYKDDMGSGSLGRDEQGRKKVGRPIAYKGDPNSPHLTEDERRRIKR